MCGCMQQQRPLALDNLWRGTEMGCGGVKIDSYLSNPSQDGEMCSQAGSLAIDLGNGVWELRFAFG